MCDTIVALGNSTKDGAVLFAKNSDREPNEAHEITVIPAAKHAPGEKVKCTYIEIPQVEETYRVILSKPFWIWGAEMGSNEFGVTIGNEAVFTREPYQKEPGLIGMDFLRLAIERSRDAETALNTIIELLERYGQSGNGGYSHSFYYHNSYLICDTESAWVLETAGKEWAAEKVQDIRSISNGLTIGAHWERCSAHLIDHAVEKGWCKKAEEFNFSRCYSEPIYTFFADARSRQTCTMDQLKEKKGHLVVSDLMHILRTHTHHNHEPYTPGKGLAGADVCMHAAWGPVRNSQTAGSMVSSLQKGAIIHWLTGTAAPCTSAFKPVWLEAGLPDNLKKPGAKFDDQVMFWQHELLHREIIKDYPARIGSVSVKRDAYEAKALRQAESLVNASIEEKKKFITSCFDEVKQMEAEMLSAVRSIPVKGKNHFYYNLAWGEFNKEAGLKE